MLPPALIHLAKVQWDQGHILKCFQFDSTSRRKEITSHLVSPDHDSIMVIIANYTMLKTGLPSSFPVVLHHPLNM